MATTAANSPPRVSTYHVPIFSLPLGKWRGSKGLAFFNLKNVRFYPDFSWNDQRDGFRLRSCMSTKKLKNRDLILAYHEPQEESGKAGARTNKAEDKGSKKRRKKGKDQRVENFVAFVKDWTTKGI
ncbi:hypothetical protein E8E11_007161 [Didymella keratinophila]|nr:hypothetical protein E8E11_007161 [Didymella keratinophila]